MQTEIRQYKDNKNHLLTICRRAGVESFPFAGAAVTDRQTQSDIAKTQSEQKLGTDGPVDANDEDGLVLFVFP